MTKGETIRILREKAGISQTELAEKTGIMKQNLYKYEKNIITNIPSDKIEAIADVLGVSPGRIMGWEVNSDADYTNMAVSAHEKEVITAYRSKSDEVKTMVDKMLDVAPEPEIQITAEPKEYARTAAYGGGTKIVPRPKKSGEELSKMVEEAEQNNILAEIRANKAKNKKT